MVSHDNFVDINTMCEWLDRNRNSECEKTAEDYNCCRQYREVEVWQQGKGTELGPGKMRNE